MTDRVQESYRKKAYGRVCIPKDRIFETSTQNDTSARLPWQTFRVR